MIEAWNSFSIDGWGSYVLKEKFKKLKGKLKEWNKHVVGNFDVKLKAANDELARLDTLEDSVGLSEDQVQLKRQVKFEFNKYLKMKALLSFQKSRLKWLKEGDCNSALFHRCLAIKRNHDTMSCIKVGEQRLEDVQQIKAAIKQHFVSLFVKREEALPTMVLDGLNFNRLNQAENWLLITSFKEVKIRSAVWDYDSDKSPSLDGVNFQFIKKFSDLFKDDFLKFVQEFHCNGKLAKG